MGSLVQVQPGEQLRAACAAFFVFHAEAQRTLSMLHPIPLYTPVASASLREDHTTP